MPTIEDMKGKYRFRTWLRMHTPWVISERIPKGRHDCGNHEWYPATDGVWKCVHCEFGETRKNPWTPLEQLSIKLAALSEIVGRANGSVLSDFDESVASRLVGEVEERIHSDLVPILPDLDTAGPEEIENQPAEEDPFEILPIAVWHGAFTHDLTNLIELSRGGHLAFSREVIDSWMVHEPAYHKILFPNHHVQLLLEQMTASTKEDAIELARQQVKEVREKRRPPESGRAKSRR